MKRVSQPRAWSPPASPAGVEKSEEQKQAERQAAATQQLAKAVGEQAKTAEQGAQQAAKGLEQFAKELEGMMAGGKRKARGRGHDPTRPFLAG